MYTYEIVVHFPGKVSKRYRVPPSGLVAGRATSSGLTLPDQLVSRQHARIWLEDGALRVKDLDSRNGVFVNGERVREGALQEGDKLHIGDHVLEVTRYSDTDLGRTVISFEEGSALCEEARLLDTGRLPHLYRAAQLLGTVFDGDALLQQILELIFEALPVRRGFVLTRAHPEDEAEIRAQRARDGEQDGPPLSSTLIDLVFQERKAILTADAREDSRFDGAVSIIGHQIQAAMCAPMCSRDNVAGVIYVDAGATNARFSGQDLELLTSIARVVGVAVENAQLYKEKLEQERLAAIGEATAGLGHCIKNILTGIRGGAEFVDIAFQKQDISYLERAWPIMSRAIQRIDMLVMNLLTFSKERVPDLTETNMNALIEDVFDVLRGRAEKAGVTLRVERDPVGKAEVDGREIYRVLMNLATNAIEACEKSGGEVTGRCVCDELGCALSVSDTGHGIPAELLPKLSRAFVSTKGSGGTGLGLACSYKIVREHGGTVTVESEVGKGTTFTIFLPSADAPAPAAGRRRTGVFTPVED